LTILFHPKYRLRIFTIISNEKMRFFQVIFENKPNPKRAKYRIVSAM